MLDAKDVARKIVSGCGHTATVVVPCAGCIEGQMHAWEASVRDNAKAEFREEWARLTTEAAKDREAAARVATKNEELHALNVRLREVNARGFEELKAARREIDNLKAQLHAEQAMKQTVKLSKVAAR
jgi:hypothetical protein